MWTERVTVPHIRFRLCTEHSIRPPMFACHIFTDRAGRLAKLYFNDYNIRRNLSDGIQLFINDLVFVFLDGFISACGH